MKVGITGHSPERLHDEQEKIREWLSWYLSQLKEEYGDDLILITGSARGVDQMAALEAIRQDIRIHCYFAYEAETHSEIEKYLIEKAEKVRYETKQLQTYSYKDRDSRIVRDSDFMLVVWDGQKQGGTYQTVQTIFALQRGAAFYPWNSFDFMGDIYNPAG